jgi:hypothetical protein
VSNLGGFNYYLDIEVIQEEDRIMVRQSSYAIHVGGWEGELQSLSCHVPVESSIKLGKLVEGELIDASMYRSSFWNPTLSGKL